MSELRERELRDLLDRVSAIDGDVDVDEHWVAGRRRRTRRGAGIAVVTGVALVAAAGAVAQTGLLGGSDDAPTGVAAVPGHLETFVFAAPGATGSLDETQEVRAPGEDELAGTQWLLQAGMWSSTTVAADLTGTTEQTALTFAPATSGGGWSITIDSCGVAQVSDLQLDDRGRFVGADPRSTDVGCSDDVQTAEDFWMEALSRGGQLSLLGDGQRLLLSVEVQAQSTPTPTTGPEPTPTLEPGDDDSPSDDGTAAPADGTAAPTDPGTGAPGTEPSAPTRDPGGSAAPPPAPAGPPFLDPTQESVDQPWPGGVGGELFAPTVRAGVHEGFDRVVVDLTGSGDLGWQASYTTDPRLDGSGLPSDIAGDSVLELWLTGMAYPEPGSDVYAEGIFGLDTHTLGAVVEVQRTAPFEGMLQVFVGMQGEPRPYRVFLLEDPMRLVIDVQTSP